MRVGILMAALILFSSGVVQAVFIDFGIVKVAEYFQTDTNTVVLDTEVPYEFFAFYEESVEETVTSVKILDGEGGLIDDLVEFALDDIWELEDDFINKAALDLAWPNDLYHMEITTDLLLPTSGPVFTVPLDFGVSDAYFPELPQFSNIGISGGLLEFDFTQSFTLSWNTPSAFVNGTDHLFLFVEVFDGAEEIIELETDTFQDSFFIAGGTLNLDKNYEAGLIFINVVDTDTASISGKTGVAGFASITIFDIAHVPEPRTYGFLLGLAALGFVILRRRVQ